MTGSATVSVSPDVAKVFLSIQVSKPTVRRPGAGPMGARPLLPQAVAAGCCAVLPTMLLLLLQECCCGNIKQPSVSGCCYVVQKRSLPDLAGPCPFPTAPLRRRLTR